MADEHWADIKESTNERGIHLLILAYRYLGKYVFKFMLMFVVCFYFVFDGRARQACEGYFVRLHNKNNALPGPSVANSFRLFWNFGLALMDKFSVWMGEISRDDVTMHGYEQMEALRESGQGAVILTSHLGNFEICHALSKPGQAGRLTILVHTKHAERFNKMLRRISGEDRVELLQVSEITAATAIRLSEKINAGELIAIAADRVPINSQAIVPVEFLGELAPFSTGPFILATALGAPVMMISCIKQEGRYNLYFDKLSEGGRLGRKERAKQLEQLSERFAHRLETLVQLGPFQWYNFFEFWNASSSNQQSSTEPKQAKS